MKKECIVKTKNIDGHAIIHRVVFLFILLMCCGGRMSSARDVRVSDWRFSIALENVSMVRVFDEIERKSGFVFAWSCDIDNEIHRKVSIHVSNVPINAVMEILLADSGLTYRKLDRQIVVCRCRKEAGQPAVCKADSIRQ